MPELKNVLVMIHGMRSEKESWSPFEECYEKFWNQLIEVEPRLRDYFDKKIGVQWGHPMPSDYDTEIARKWNYIKHDTLRDDEKIYKAQEVVDNRIKYQTIKDRREAGDITLTGLFRTDIGTIPGLRGLIFQLRENILIRGVGDVIYYVSAEGEKRVRSTVYEQILSNLDEYLEDDNIIVKLHLAGHSLGVTLTHDFLYGLFNGERKSGFVKERQGTKKTCDAFTKWQAKANIGSLKLGSLTSMASQLPLFVMRKQKMVDLLSDGRHLNPSDIGIHPDRGIQWKLFYEVDDLLAFATRRLYDPRDTIKDFQVSFSDLPNKAHEGYWEHQEIIRETARLMLDNK